MSKSRDATTFRGFDLRSKGGGRRERWKEPKQRFVGLNETTTAMPRRRTLKQVMQHDSRKQGLRVPVIDRSGLSTEPTLTIDYRAEGGLSGKRPLPKALADYKTPTLSGEPSRAIGSSSALVKATGWDSMSTPAFRFIGLPVIASELGVMQTTLRGHMDRPDFPRECIKKIGWLPVADIDGMATLREWLEPRRVGPNKNHIKARSKTK